MSQLAIYKASAGAGKTFMLTQEYLKLLFRTSSLYKNILAVTFTNKATNEMKSRIIGELYLLANGEKSYHLQALIQESKSNAQQVQKTAKEILTNLLHDYARFSVCTIDSFFQLVLRSFAKEIGLHAGFKIELDANKVVEELIDNLLVDLAVDDATTDWVIQLVEDRISAGKGWNYKGHLLTLAREIFNEDFRHLPKEFIAKINDRKFLQSYLADAYNIMKECKLFLSNIGKETLRKIAEAGLSIADFSFGNTGIAGYFEKLANNKDFEPGVRVLECLDDPEKWTTKKSANKVEITALVNSALLTMLSKTINFIEDNRTAYYTAQCIVGFFYPLALFGAIAERLLYYKQEKNVFLLSDTSDFIRRIIDQNDTPFIYEKIGARFQHFMIDEFQDTSGLQWGNFRPLIENGLAAGKSSLVVGDVKQSIYRWRNSDWKILAGGIIKQFKTWGTSENVLDYNWRSDGVIINFNNNLFRSGAESVQNYFNSVLTEDSKNQNQLQDYTHLIKDVYTQCEQLQPFPEKKLNGRVEIRFYPKEKGSDWKELLLNGFPRQIEGMLDNQYIPGDIVILVRRKSEGSQIARILLNYLSTIPKDERRFEVVSDESLFICNAPSVKLILLLLRHLLNPEDAIISFGLAFEYLSVWSTSNRNIDRGQLHNTIANVIENKQSGNVNSLFLDFFPREFSTGFDTFARIPLYDLVEQLIRIFELEDKPNESPYIHAFLNLLFDFQENESSDLQQFLSWWDAKGITKAVQISELKNAVKIMTIHKSKGLEFKAVIIPFCDWKLDHESTHERIIWCTPTISPFNKLEAVPVKYTKKLTDTIFFQEYYQEKIMTYIDNLNLLYVAATRAKEALIIHAPLLKEDAKPKSVANVLFDVLEAGAAGSPVDSPDEFYLAKADDAGVLTYSTKRISVPTKQETDTPSKNTLLYKYNKQQNAAPYLWVKRYGSDLYADSIPEYREKADFGVFMHRLFEQINIQSDIEEAVNSCVFKGEILSSDAEALKNTITEAIIKSDVQDWFSGKYELLKEAAILLEGGKIKRPDRIMISNKNAIIVDYKFSTEEKPSYFKQVKEYKEILQKMGYEKVDGFVWYVTKASVVKV